MRRLPLLCASNDDPNQTERFFVTGCEGSSCVFWDKKSAACSAGRELSELHQTNFTQKRDQRLPLCRIADRCAWNVEAVAIGEPGCAVRRLGLLCEHQGGEWNTFEMADPDDPCWKE